MSAELINQLKSARRVSVPLVAITTPDPAQTIELIWAAVNGDGPQIVWDVVQGLRPRNEIVTPNSRFGCSTRRWSSARSDQHGPDAGAGRLFP